MRQGRHNTASVAHLREFSSKRHPNLESRKTWSDYDKLPFVSENVLDYVKLEFTMVLEEVILIKVIFHKHNVQCILYSSNKFYI